DDIAGRLQQRTDKKVRRMPQWVPVSAAATVLIFWGMWTWMLPHNQPAKQPKIAMTEKSAPIAQDMAKAVPPAAKQSDTLEKIIKTAPAVAYSKRYADNNVVMPAQANDAPVISAPLSAQTQETLKEYKSNKENESLSEVVVSNYSLKKKDTTNNFYIGKAQQGFYADQALPGKVEGVTVTNSPSPATNTERYNMGLPPVEKLSLNKPLPTQYKQMDTAAFNSTAMGYATQSRKDKVGSATITNINPTMPGNTIIGKVMGSDGEPITGATVKAAGTTHGVVTDLNGKFKLTNTNGDQTVTVVFIGYATKHVKANGGESVNIILEPAQNSLAEVAIANPAKNVGSSQSARPRDGWAALNAYLEKNAVSADGETGKVKLSFMVDAGGNLSGFKIIKSLNKVADQKAIDLIKYGTTWLGGDNGKPQEIKITVKFH
ncbi:MAG: TonB family protein, partial [Mucilaginibacter sp.]